MYIFTSGISSYLHRERSCSSSSVQSHYLNSVTAILCRHTARCSSSTRTLALLCLPSACLSVRVSLNIQITRWGNLQEAPRVGLSPSSSAMACPSGTVIGREPRGPTGRSSWCRARTT